MERVCGWGAWRSELDCCRVAGRSAWGHGMERLEVGWEVKVGSGDLRWESLVVWVEQLGSGIGATLRLQLGRLGVVGSLFIGEFKTLGLVLKCCKGNAECLKRSVILVAQGSVKGTSWVEFFI